MSRVPRPPGGPSGRVREARQGPAEAPEGKFRLSRKGLQEGFNLYGFVFELRLQPLKSGLMSEKLSKSSGCYLSILKRKRGWSQFAKFAWLVHTDI